MSQSTTRIGLIGYGQIGRAVHQMIDANPQTGMQVAFVHDTFKDALKDVPGDLALADLNQFEDKSPDLVVEMAHPDVTRQWGKTILEKTNYMFISVTALADLQLEKDIEETTQRCGTRAFVPHGGVVGMDALLENRDVWESVDVIMKKSPHNVDCAAAGLNPDEIKDQTTLYDGPTRGICPLFPRNVNSHAAVALAGIGFERTRSVLVADPELDDSIIELRARGGGVELDIRRANPMQGVSGVFTLMSTLASIGRAGKGRPGLQVC